MTTSELSVGRDKDEGVCCWGAELKSLGGDDCARQACEPHFVAGKRHLINKFCSYCHKEILIPMQHVRALPPHLEKSFANCKGHGL